MHLLIDANNMAHRARHSFNLSFRGKDTSVLYGFMSMLISLIKKRRPRCVIVCWDGGTPAYRKRLVPSYKSGRKHAEDPTYPQLIAQMNELSEILPLTGVMQVRRTGIEADDLMYHAAKLVRDDDCLIVTSDDDLLQAIDRNVRVLVPGKKERVMDKFLFEEMYGYPISKFVAAKVLQGDGSDNVPGVRGIGPKTATKLMTGATVFENATPSIARKILAFVSSGDYNRAYTVIDLSQDLCGARMALLGAGWRRYTRAFDRWCIDNGFISLIERQSLSSVFGRLRRPGLVFDNVCVPRIWQYRRYPIVGQEE